MHCILLRLFIRSHIECRLCLYLRCCGQFVMSYFNVFWLFTARYICMRILMLTNCLDFVHILWLRNKVIEISEEFLTDWYTWGRCGFHRRVVVVVKALLYQNMGPLWPRWSLKFKQLTPCSQSVFKIFFSFILNILNKVESEFNINSKGQFDIVLLFSCKNVWRNVNGLA